MNSKVIETPTIGAHRFEIPANVRVNATDESLSFYMHPESLNLLNRDEGHGNLFIQVKNYQSPDIDESIRALEEHGGVVGGDVYSGLTPATGGGGDGKYFIQHRYGGASILCASGGAGCRALVPYQDLTISIRFDQSLLPSWERVIDGVLHKIEEMEF